MKQRKQQAYALLTALTLGLPLLAGCGAEATSADNTTQPKESAWEQLKESIVGERYDVAAGSRIEVRLSQALSTKTNRSGDEFAAELAGDLNAEGVLVAPVGSEVRGRVVEAGDGGRVKGRAYMVLTLETLKVGDKSYDLDTHSLTFRAKGTKKEDAVKIGVGSGVGAVIGAIAGGGDGAAKGAGAGAAAGTAFVLLTKGDQIHLGAEHRVGFTLEEDLSLPAFKEQ